MGPSIATSQRIGYKTYAPVSNVPYKNNTRIYWLLTQSECIPTMHQDVIGAHSPKPEKAYTENDRVLEPED